jgi:hypothetical protein
MIFKSKANCFQFVPNSFKKDVCSMCQCRIQDHSAASEDQIRQALEYSIDKGSVIKLQMLQTLILI